MSPFVHKRILVGAAVGAVGIVVAAAFAIAVTIGDSGRAEDIPGSVEQSASASGGGFTIAVERALFSGAGVNIGVSVRSDEAGRLAGGAGVDGWLDGVPATSVFVYGDGRTTLRFPVEAWTEGAASGELEVRSVLVAGKAGPERIPLDLRLPVEFPQGSDAEAARQAEAFPPVTVDVEGQGGVAVEAVRAGSTVVVRYRLPDGMFATQPPSLRAGGSALEPDRVEQRDVSWAEAWFEQVPGDGAIVFELGGLRGPDADSKGWTVNVAVGSAGPLSPAPGGEGEQLRELSWTRQPGSDGPEVHLIQWFQDVGRLEIFLEGFWDPGPGEENWPVVVADGEALEVVGVGGLYATSERGPLTTITVELEEDQEPPRELAIRVTGGTKLLPPVEVELGQ